MKRFGLIISIIIFCSVTGYFILEYNKPTKIAAPVVTNYSIKQEPISITIEDEPSVDDPDIGIINDASSIDKKTGQWRGLCPKDSINTIDDFKKVVTNDPILARHFITFNFNNALIKELPAATEVKVAHKKGNVIKRTVHSVTLPKGDVYITDGLTKARMHCCNDFDFNELPPPSAGNPPQYASPPVYIVPPTTETLIPPVEQYVPYTSVGESLHTIHHIRHDPPPPPPVAPVPDPGTFILFGTGITCLALIKRFFNGKK